ncbi:uncharacterized protein sb:cb1058 [Hippocampus zosterae]|uniref:uncharacterized protein sb:cb1058 n=1 Tax=Hippocampus zosterae TaxID=109293 RepID=UPI00223E8CA7|nr:uncharacterized protein sb:cb1058 [Hippocampus zosterae]
MTIGKDSRKSSVRASIRAPKFLDKSGGFYDRLDELESAPLKDILAMDGGSDVDDGQTLLWAAPSGRWKRKSSRRMRKQAASQEASALGSASPRVAEAHTHFASRHDSDERVLIRDEKRMKREQEQVMKVVKRDAVKTYRKAVDRAFRRGWEAFVANIFSITLTPVHSSQNKHQA